MHTYLLTGGNGFIGSHLVRKLVEQKQKVHIIIEKNSDMWRLHDLIQHVTMHEIDLTDFATITKIVSLIRPEVIFHLASYGGMPFQLDQKTIFNVNFHGTVNLINACKSVGFLCFINTGSSSEYGMKSTPMHEQDVLEPVSDYAVSKAAATQFCLKEALFHKLPIYTVRPFSVYGNYEMETRLIPTILINTINNKEMKLSSPHFVRDFIFIEDMTKIYFDIVEKMPTENHIFNAGSGNQSTIANVLASVQSLWPQQLKISWGMSEPRPWEPKHWKASIQTAQTVLGWKPQNTLREGLRKTLKWFEKNQDLYPKQVHEKPPTPTITKAL